MERKDSAGLRQGRSISTCLQVRKPEATGESLTNSTSPTRNGWRRDLEWLKLAAGSIPTTPP
jgi:hypothetical protein